MKKQFLLLIFTLASLPLYSMESTEDFNNQLNAHVASDAFEENFLKDFNEKRIEEIAETIKGLNQCFPSLSEDNATKIQTIIREKLSDNQQKAIFQKLLEQKEWNVATSWAVWSDSDPLKLKIDLAISLQPLLDNEQWNEAAEWILNNIKMEQAQALMPYINQLITQNKIDGLLVLQEQLQTFNSKDSAKFLSGHIELAIKDHTTQNLPIEQTIQNSNNNSNNNSRMENDNVSTQPNLYSDSNNNNEKIENKNRQTATIATSDGQRDLDATELGILKSESVTIANLLEDFQEEHVTISLEQITSDQFNEILSLLKTIHENKLLSNKELKEIIIKQLCQKQSEKQEVTGKEGKQEEEPATAEYSVKKLITLLKTVDYLDIQYIELLLDCSSDLLAKKLVTPDELKQFIEDPEYLSMLNQLPAQLKRALANKIPTSHLALLSKKLDIDFTHQTLNDSAWVNSVAFSPDGCLLASASDDNTVKIYFIDKIKNEITLFKTLNDHESYVRSVAFSPNGHLLASASDDKTVKIYSIDKIKNEITLLTTLNDHEFSVLSVAFSPDGNLLASAFINKTVKIYSIDKIKNEITLFKTLNDHERYALSVAFSPDSHLLASASDDSTVKIYSIDKKKNEITHFKDLDDHKSAVYSVAFSPDGQLLASASLDDTVKIYYIDKKKNEITHFKDLDDHKSAVVSVAFSPDGCLLTSASYDKTVQIYSIDKIKNEITHLKTLNDHEKTVKSVAFSPDGRLLASASADHTVNVYDLLSLSSNLLIEQLLLLDFCINNNEPLDLNKHPHLRSIFDSLPKQIKNQLIENEKETANVKSIEDQLNTFIANDEFEEDFRKEFKDLI